jgi:hypothetical protein
LSALTIFSFGGLSPERTMLIADGATPYFFAHAFLASLSLYFRTKQANYVLLIQQTHVSFLGPASVE